MLVKQDLSFFLLSGYGASISLTEKQKSVFLCMLVMHKKDAKLMKV